MDYGLVRVGAAVPSIKVADCSYNVRQISLLMNEAEQKGVQIVCFPEMCITGYTCGDLFHQKVLIDKSEEYFGKLLTDFRASKMLAIVGMPVRIDSRLVNAAVVFQSGKILAVVPKSWLPNYGEFYEKRWFASAKEVSSAEIILCGQKVYFGTNILICSGNVKMAVELCEDFWMTIPPSSYHALHGANLICNLSASNDIIAKNDYRKTLVSQQSSRCIAGYVYTSSGFGESTTDVVFSGSAFIAENGSFLAESERFSMDNQLIVSDIDVDRLNGDRIKNTGFTSEFTDVSDPYRFVNCKLKPFSENEVYRRFDSHPFVPSGKKLDDRCKEIFSIQISALAKRLLHINAKNVIIGISGGLDSTLALLVAAFTFDKLNIPRENIIGITMPGMGTTDRTYNNAVNLINTIGAELREIPINNAVKLHFKDIDHDINIHDVTYENSQARERTQILMDVSNQVKGIVLGTGDLSELALGWATYNGDHMSMYGINVGIPKTLVKFLVKWVADNKTKESVSEILFDIIDTPVSPELLPADEDGDIQQKTESLVGPYDLHDFFLYNMLRFGFEPHKIEWMANKAFAGVFSKEIIHKWIRVFFKRFFAQQFKRSCLPDGPKVGSISLSPRGDWRMPSDAIARVWLDDLD